MITHAIPSKSKRSAPGKGVYCKLEQLAELRSGRTPSRKQSEYFGGTIPWVKTGDLNNSYILSTQETLTDKGIEDSSCPMIPPGSVLVAMYGGYNQIGRTGLLKFEAAINQALTAVLPDPNRLHSEFLLHWLNFRVNDWKTFAASSRKDPNITKNDVGSFPVLLLSISDQKKIAEIITSWDAAIEKIQTLIGCKVLHLQGLREKLTSKPLRNRNARQGFWPVVRFAEVATDAAERNDGKFEGDRLFAVTKANGLVPMRERVKGENHTRCKLIKCDDFAYNPMRLNIGSIARWREKRPIMVSGDYVTFRCKCDKILPDYVEHLRQTRAWNNFVSSAGNGSVRVRIYFNDLGRFAFKLPTLSEQRCISDLLNAYAREIKLLEGKASALKNQKMGLMQRLLSGDMPVKV